MHVQGLLIKPEWSTHVHPFSSLPLMVAAIHTICSSNTWDYVMTIAENMEKYDDNDIKLEY